MFCQAGFEPWLTTIMHHLSHVSKPQATDDVCAAAGPADAGLAQAPTPAAASPVVAAGPARGALCRPRHGDGDALSASLGRRGNGTGRRRGQRVGHYGHAQRRPGPRHQAGRCGSSTRRSAPGRCLCAPVGLPGRGRGRPRRPSAHGRGKASALWRLRCSARPHRRPK